MPLGKVPKNLNGRSFHVSHRRRPLHNSLLRLSPTFAFPRNSFAVVVVVEVALEWHNSLTFIEPKLLGFAWHQFITDSQVFFPETMDANTVTVAYLKAPEKEEACCDSPGNGARHLPEPSFWNKCGNFFCCCWCSRTVS
jgi:hypothetical protein